MPTLAPIIVPQHQFVKTIARALRSGCGLPAGSDTPHRVVVATSGGADSVALLRAVAALADRRSWNLQLAVGHVQHHLRQEAENDARFVADLARDLKLPLLRADLTLDHCAGNLEADARRQRYRALEALAIDFNAQYVATAHHGDDQLETLLMRLLRGSSVRGLRCMAWRRSLHRGGRVDLLRPMLGVDRQGVCGFLRDLNQTWRHDRTNSDLSRLRARLRHDVLPVLRDVCPDAAAKSVATAGHMQQICRWLDAASTQNLPDDNETTLNRSEAQQMPEVVLVNLLRRRLVAAGALADRIGLRTLGPILRAIHDQKGGRRVFTLNGGLQIVLTRQTIQINRAGQDHRPV